MKMRNLLPAVLLGLLAVIHSSPIDSMTQIPARPEEDVLEEAMTDGFLVEHFVGPSFTTEPPKINATVQASQQPSLEILPEGSGFYPTSTTESHETTTTNVQTFFVDASEGSGFLGTTTSPTTKTPEITRTISPSPQVTFETTDEGSGFTESPSTESSTLSTSIPQTSTDFLAGGNGDSSVFSSGATTTSVSVSAAATPTSTMESVESSIGLRNNSQGKLLSGFIGGLGTNQDEVSTDGVSTKQVHHPHEDTGTHKGHSTPDWIIILAFLVALAALVALCAAIATRDKWNGPQQTSEKITNAQNQKREQEMQTFLHKNEPKENGMETEYTVIPLDDLADHHS
ncbi:location of vulva defective 1-like [Poecilia latipinna]|uniref:location of vulva defective 1-like n=1 Tax=Poecilia latipinna TaxID=48699 RepID=UPI00072EA18A|nr:PREDICTED: location of vulva defective 1-like [Poecilia latipinna]